MTPSTQITEEELLSLPRYLSDFGGNVRRATWFVAILKAVLLVLSILTFILWLIHPGTKVIVDGVILALFALPAFGLLAVLLTFLALLTKKSVLLLLFILYSIIEIVVLIVVLIGSIIMFFTGDWAEIFSKADKEGKTTTRALEVILVFLLALLTLIFTIRSLYILRRCQKFHNELAAQKPPHPL